MRRTTATKGSDYRATVRYQAPLADVYDAAAEPCGANGWWTTRGEIAQRAGGLMRLDWSGEDYILFRLDQLERPHAMRWTCIEQSDSTLAEPDEWVGTTLSFRFVDEGGTTRLDFVHHGLVPKLACFDVCEGGWDFSCAEASSGSSRWDAGCRTTRKTQRTCRKPIPLRASSTATAERDAAEENLAVRPWSLRTRWTVARLLGGELPRLGCPLKRCVFVEDRQGNPSQGELMRYAVLIYDKPGSYESLPPDELEKVMAEYGPITADPSVRGGARLQPVHTATTVRVQDGETLLTDGPFADTKEVFGGFYLVDVPDLDAALQFAARIPSARLGGAIEVRPIVER